MKTPVLKKQVIKIFQKFGLSKDHALISTNALINAELVGAYGHGLSRLKMYCDRISKKVINPKPKIKIKKISPSISHIDANNSIGFVAADLGIKTAIKHAQKTGIGMVAVKNSGHYGLSGYYAEQAVKKNLITMIYTNAPPAVAPHGALRTLFGTNPICFGTPSGGKVPFILDTSVSMINRGKIRVAANLGHKIPLLANCQPAGEHLMEGFYRAGGIPAIMKELMKHKKIHQNLITVTGKTVAQNLRKKINVDRDVIKTFKDNLTDKAGFLVMKGNFFSSAIMKTSVISKEFRERYLSNPKHPNVFKGKAVVFEGPEDYHKRINSKIKIKFKNGNIINYKINI